MNSLNACAQTIPPVTLAPSPAAVLRVCRVCPAKAIASRGVPTGSTRPLVTWRKQQGSRRPVVPPCAAQQPTIPQPTGSPTKLSWADTPDRVARPYAFAWWEVTTSAVVSTSTDTPLNLLRYTGYYGHEYPRTKPHTNPIRLLLRIVRLHSPELRKLGRHRWVPPCQPFDRQVLCLVVREPEVVLRPK